MEISQEIRVAELWFLCTVLLQQCVLSVTFQVDSFYSLEDLAQTKIQKEN